MGNFFTYHISEESGLRRRVGTPEELSDCRGLRYKNILYYYPDPNEHLPFFLRECGEEHSVPEKSVVRRVNLKNTYLHYVTGGNGFFNGTPVGAGQAFLAWAGAEHTIANDPKDPLSFFYIGMSGFAHEALLESLGFARERTVFPYSYADRVRAFMQKALYTAAPQENNRMGYLLGEVILLLSLGQPTQKAAEEDAGLRDVALAKSLMAQNRYRLSVAELSAALGISRNRFGSVFHRITGVTPKAYIIQHRMELAKNFLVNGYSVAQVAELLGYCDYAAFYNAFRQSTGVTPKAYVEFVRNERSCYTKRGT